MNRIVEFLDTFALAAITSTEDMCAPLHLLDSLIDSAIIAWQLLMTMDFMTFPVATGWDCQYLSGYHPAAANTTHIYFGGLAQVSQGVLFSLSCSEKYCSLDVLTVLQLFP